jgi:hypothetical protein
MRPGCIGLRERRAFGNLEDLNIAPMAAASGPDGSSAAPSDFVASRLQLLPRFD